MSLQITNFDELDTTRVQELLALFSGWMQEKHPEVELSRGVFHDLVLYFNSVLNAALRENINRVMQSNSLLAITQNPALADPTIVDQVLSNFNVTRETGETAVGEAMIVVKQNITTQISSTIRFTAGGVSFFPSATFVGVPKGSADSSLTNARTMVEAQNGSYVFKIPVVAYFAGAAGNITKGTTLVPDVAPNNVSAIFAAVDFIKGADPITNAEYIAKLSTGLAAKTVGGRKSFNALIRAQPEFKLTRHISVVGFGDPEQLRDQRGLFPVSGGGRVDIYVQTHDIAQRTDHIVTARYIGPTDSEVAAAGTLWEIAINRDLYPGFYSVARVAQIPTNAAYAAAPREYTITKSTPALFWSAGEYKPDILNTFEAAFTRYKTEIIRFIDDDKKSSEVMVGDTAGYLLTTVGMPLIGQMQDFLSGNDVRCRTADVVVRAAVPCFTSISFKVRRAANETDPDFAAMKKDIVAAIAKLGFSGELSASTITTAAAAYLTGQQSINAIDIFGKLLRPSGDVVYLRDPERITVPNDPANMVSAKTVVFLTSVDDIAITPELVASYGD
jgi:hypothetical protein